MSLLLVVTFVAREEQNKKTGFLLQAPRCILDFVLFCACVLEIKSNELR